MPNVELNNNCETITELFQNHMDDIYENAGIDKEITDKIIAIEQPFYSNLSKEQKKQFEEIGDLETQRHEKVYKNIFIYAFSLANKLLIESLTKGK